jgi:hypothetical protein
VIELTLGEYMFVIAFSTGAGAVAALGLFVFLRSYVAGRRESRRLAEWTPVDDDWLDSWGIRP